MAVTKLSKAVNARRFDDFFGFYLTMFGSNPPSARIAGSAVSFQTTRRNGPDSSTCSTWTRNCPAARVRSRLPGHVAVSELRCGAFRSVIPNRKLRCCGNVTIEDRTRPNVRVVGRSGGGQERTLNEFDTLRFTIRIGGERFSYNNRDPPAIIRLSAALPGGALLELSKTGRFCSTAVFTRDIAYARPRATREEP